MRRRALGSSQDRQPDALGRAQRLGRLAACRQIRRARHERYRQSNIDFPDRSNADQHVLRASLALAQRPSSSPAKMRSMQATEAQLTLRLPSVAECGEMKTWVIGVNWYLNDYVRLMFNYAQSDLSGYPTTPAQTTDDRGTVTATFRQETGLTAPRSAASACAPKSTFKTGKAEPTVPSAPRPPPRQGRRFFCAKRISKSWPEGTEL